MGEDEDFIKSLEFSFDDLDNEPQGEQGAPVNFSRKLREMQEKLTVIEDFNSTEELEWLREQIATKKGHQLLDEIKKLNEHLRDVRKHQDHILHALNAPAINQKEISRADLIRLTESSADLKKEMSQIDKHVKALAAKHDKKEHAPTELGALSESVESLRNTTFMLNKKIDMINNDDRIIMVENKLKEVIQYLHQLNSQLAK